MFEKPWNVTCPKQTFCLGHVAFQGFLKIRSPSPQDGTTTRSYHHRHPYILQHPAYHHPAYHQLSTKEALCSKEAHQTKEALCTKGAHQTKQALCTKGAHKTKQALCTKEAHQTKEALCSKEAQQLLKMKPAGASALHRRGPA
jgi:hypothetical protein